MASFKAILDIGGEKFDVLTCEYSLHQATNINGEADASVRSGFIRIAVTPIHEHQILSDWAKDTKGKKEGKVTFYNIDNEFQTFRTLKFENAYCVSYREVFTPYSGVTGAFQIDINITAGIMHINTRKHDNLWTERSKN